jgi:glycine cleavage system H protein
MQVPQELRYLKSHEWARIEDGKVTVGVTEYAVEQLNRDIVFVELPQVGAQVKQGQPFGVIEAVKAVYDLYSPASGKVIAINEEAANDASIVGREPFTGGWLIQIEAENPGEFDNLLDAEKYKEAIESEEH